MTIPTSRKLEKRRIKECVRAKRAEGFVFLGRKHAILLNIPDGKSQVFFRYNNVLVLVHLLAFIRTELKSNDKLQNVSTKLQNSSSPPPPPPPPPWTLMSSIGSVDLRVDSENILIHFLSPPPPPPRRPAPITLSFLSLSHSPTSPSGPFPLFCLLSRFLFLPF